MTFNSIQLFFLKSLLTSLYLFPRVYKRMLYFFLFMHILTYLQRLATSHTDRFKKG